MTTAIHCPFPRGIANWLALSSILLPHAQIFLRQSTFSVSLCTLLPQCIMNHYSPSPLSSPDHIATVTLDSSLSLRAYSDAGWVDDPDTHRSTTDLCIFLGSSLISWRSK